MNNHKPNLDFERYLEDGIADIMKGILKASLHEREEASFMAHYAMAVRRANVKREKAARQGEHIPPFLIASITDQCNLHCAGCYAWENDICGNGTSTQLEASYWDDIFSQAEELGIPFILLAGGEPFLRSDVLQEAARHEDILFPVFTNGTVADDEAIALIERHRNLVPILSIEGGKERTDQRRGQGVYDRLQCTMRHLREHRVLFGSSITVTSDNLEEVFSDAFLDGLEEVGARGVIYVEYVPFGGARQIALDNSERAQMTAAIARVRQERDETLFLSFPGDEAASGGCLAAGRGFFHINVTGGVEPCPFSPYSDTSLLDTSLRDAMKSPFFACLSEKGLLNVEHTGGCVLFEHEQEVKDCLECASA